MGRESGGARGWGVVVILNLIVLSALFFGITEWFIAHKRVTTLIYRPSARFHHELLPDQLYRRDALSYRIGPDGLRGTVRTSTVVVGGSSVFDFRVEPSWPERMGATNGGIPGYSLREVVPFYEDRIRALRPRTVLIYVGWNDLKYISASREQLTLPPFPRDGPPSSQYDFLLASRPTRNFLSVPMMFERFRENSAPKIQIPTATVAWKATPGLAYFREQLNTLIDRIEADGAKPILVLEITLASRDLPEKEQKRIALHYVQMTYEDLLLAIDAVAGVLHDVARERKLPCVDVRAELNGKPELFTDHVHLSERGSEALSGALRERLKTQDPRLTTRETNDY